MKVTDDLRSWAQAYRDVGTAPDALRDRVRAAVATDVVPGHRRGWAAGLVVGALLGAAAVALLVWASGLRTPQREAGTAPMQAPYEGASPTPGGVADEPARPDASRPRPAPEAPAAEADPALTPGPESQPPAARDVVRGGSGRGGSPGRPEAANDAPRRDAATTPAATPRASEDLESLRRLHAAERLLSTDPGLARAKLEAHVRDYPRSALAVEREALWIRAACLSGGAPALVRRRAAFAKRPGVAAYRRAIGRDCDGAR